MTCSKCSTGNARLQKAPYRYSESGLPNIMLENVKWWKCQNCSSTQVDIPRIGQLHRCLGWLVVTKSSLLTGPEIVFLRKLLRKSQKDLADYLGIKQAVLSRWETESRKSHSKANDGILRLTYIALVDDEYTHKINRELNRLLMNYFGHVKLPAHPVKAKIDPMNCDPQRIFDNSISLINGQCASELVCIPSEH
jgi:putative zinc finger/helix-turn-helix YgiT family protein